MVLFGKIKRYFDLKLFFNNNSIYIENNSSFAKMLETFVNSPCNRQHAINSYSLTIDTSLNIKYFTCWSINQCSYFMGKLLLYLGSVHKWRHLKFGVFRPPPHSPHPSLYQTPLDDVIFYRPSPFPRWFSAKLFFYGKILKWRNQDSNMLDKGNKI